MAYKITDSCLKCGILRWRVPMNAISEGEDQYVIDADTCVGCGTCADACPRSGYCRGVRRSYTITSGHTAEPFRRMLPRKLVRNCVTLFTEPACAVLRRPVFN